MSILPLNFKNKIYTDLETLKAELENAQTFLKNDISGNLHENWIITPDIKNKIKGILTRIYKLIYELCENISKKEEH